MEYQYVGSQHQVTPPQYYSGAPPPMRGSHLEDPSELAVTCSNCVAILDRPHCDNFQFNEMLDHKMGYDEVDEAEVDVKPPKEDQPPKTSIFCLRNENLLNEIEKIEECFILEFDPYCSVATYPLTSSKPLYDHDAGFINVVKEGEVACRDYAHSRHDCAMYPFNTNPHNIHCKMCYCYVCDEPAPCEQWTKQSSFFKHCNATPQNHIWRDLRNAKKRKIDAYFDECFSQVGLCSYEVDNHFKTSHLNQLPEVWE